MSETSIPGHTTILSPARILIVENDPLLAQAITLHVEAVGHKVVAILARGEEVLEQGMALSPDLILMDIVLDGALDEVETARQIQDKLDVPVVFLTAYADEALIKRAFTTAPFAYLQKPPKEHELLLTLELALSHHQSEMHLRQVQDKLEKQVAIRTAELSAANKALQQKLDEQQATNAVLQRFRATLDHSSDSIFLIDRATMRFIDVNQTACNTLGYTREELLMMGPQDIKPFFTRAMLEQQFDDIAYHPAQNGVIDTFHKSRNGELFPVEVRLRTLKSRGSPVIVAIARDITANKEHEEALRLSEEKFRRLFENSPIGIALVSLDRRLMESNPAFCAMLGYSEKELEYMPLADITFPADGEAGKESQQQLLSGKITSFTLEKRYLRKNGTPFWARLNASIVRDQTGQPMYSLGMVEDIDHIKQAESLRLAHEAEHRNALVREVHHRIKNHIQGVIGLLRQRKLNDLLCRTVIEETIAQISSVAIVHGLQGSDTDDDISLPGMLTAIATSFEGLVRPGFDATLTNILAFVPRIARDEAVPIALALNELIMNAAKHGSGSAQITLEGEPGRIVVRITNPIQTTNSNIQSGSGIELVRMLLPRQGTRLSLTCDNHAFIAEIGLSPPVIVTLP